MIIYCANFFVYNIYFSEHIVYKIFTKKCFITFISQIVTLVKITYGVQVQTCLNVFHYYEIMHSPIFNALSFSIRVKYTGKRLEL